LGDIFLLFPQKKLFFIAGLPSFLTGHIFYTVIFLQKTSLLSIIPGWFYFLLTPYIWYGIFIFYKLNPYLNSMIVPVIVYINILLFMSFASLTCIWVIKGFAFWLPFTGSMLFIVSDTLLAFRNFKHRTPKGRISVMMFYIFAQLLIVLGFL